MLNKKNILFSILSISVIIFAGIFLYKFSNLQQKDIVVTTTPVEKIFIEPKIENGTSEFSWQKIIDINSQDIKKIEQELIKWGFVPNTWSNLSWAKTFLWSNSIKINKNKNLPVSLLIKSKNTLNKDYAQVNYLCAHEAFYGVKLNL